MATYLWDFGDGNTSVERFPRHEYIDPGAYTVTLSVDGGPAAVQAEFVSVGIGAFTWRMNTGVTAGPNPIGYAVAQLAAYLAWASTQSRTAQSSGDLLSTTVPFSNDKRVEGPWRIDDHTIKIWANGYQTFTGTNDLATDGSVYHITEWEVGPDIDTKYGWHISLFPSGVSNPDQDYGGGNYEYPTISFIGFSNLLRVSGWADPLNDPYRSELFAEPDFTLAVGDKIGVLVGYGEMVFFVNGVFKFRTDIVYSGLNQDDELTDFSYRELGRPMITVNEDAS